MQDSCVQTDGLRQQKRSGGENVTDPCLWAFLLHEWRNKNYFNSCVKFPTTISKVNRCFPQSRQLLCWKLESSWLGRSQKSVPELKAETASSQMKQQQKPGWDGGDFAAFMSVQVWTLLSSFVPSTTFSSLRRPPPCSSMCSCSRDADSS